MASSKKKKKKQLNQKRSCRSVWNFKLKDKTHLHVLDECASSNSQRICFHPKNQNEYECASYVLPAWVACIGDFLPDLQKMK